MKPWLTSHYQLLSVKTHRNNFSLVSILGSLMFLWKCLVYLKDTVNHSVLCVLHHIFKSLRGSSGLLKELGACFEVGSWEQRALRPRFQLLPWAALHLFVFCICIRFYLKKGLCGGQKCLETTDLMLTLLEVLGINSNLESEGSALISLSHNVWSLLRHYLHWSSFSPRSKPRSFQLHDC